MNEIAFARARIRGFILDRFPLARKNRVSESDSLLENGIVDSLGILELIEYIEGEFRIAVSDEELVPENFQSIQHIAAFVERKRDGRGE